MKRLLILVAILAMPTMSSAQIIEEVHTKNGSKYAGYISEQIPGKQMSVCTESAYIVFFVIFPLLLKVLRIHQV